ncbi:MAG: hypothetical protein ACK4UJ_00715 [Leptonema sp. (in: bacteria)]
MKVIEFYKEIYKKIFLHQKSEELLNLLEQLENFDDKVIFQDSILTAMESFSKPYPMPLYLFSFLAIIKICSILKKSLNQNYHYYFNIYNDLRKREDLKEEEMKLLNEVSEMLYRMDEIQSKFHRVVLNLITTIKKNFSREIPLEDVDFFYFQIDKDSYYQIYNPYEEFIDLILTLVDEIKIEKGLYKLCTMLLKQ